jgi:hypothetical protein
MEDRWNDPFPVVSFGERTPPTWEETVFGDHPRWKEGERGPRKGSVTITETGRDFEATFTFDGGEDLQYSGAIPGDGSWRGKSRARKRRGAGRDEIEVDSVNPKRWG